MWKKTRTRQVSQQPLNGGSACPELTETDVCQKVDCEVGDWGNFGACVDSNGIWRKTRTREIKREPKYGGSSCPELTEAEVCPKVDCGISDWGEWSACVDTNGVWKKTRTRQVTQQPQHGGSTCPSLEETEVCPKVDCEYGDWSPDFNCFVDTDGSLKKIRTRIITRQPQYGGAKCPEPEKSECVFIKGGKISGPYFDLTITDYTRFSGQGLRLDKNIGKKIRIFYERNPLPVVVGWGVQEDWVYPEAFGGAVKADNLNTVGFTSALEFIGGGNKILIWFNDPQLPRNNARGAIQEIVQNRMENKSISIMYGGDANNKFLSSDNAVAKITFGGEVVVQGACLKDNGIVYVGCGFAYGSKEQATAQCGADKIKEYSLITRGENPCALEKGVRSIYVTDVINEVTGLNNAYMKIEYLPRVFNILDFVGWIGDGMS